MPRSRYQIAAVLISLSANILLAQQRTVAITVDDLPYAGGATSQAAITAHAPDAVEINRSILSTLREYRAPATGFVIQQRVDWLGSEGISLLKDWVNSGFDLGNHSRSHSDMNALSVSQVQEEIIAGEPAAKAIMREAGKKLEFFRFPMNETGDTKEKNAAVASFLADRGYRVAACTIDGSDFIFNDAYIRMLGANDSVSAQKLRSEYVQFTAAEIDYYAALNKKVLGYEPAEIMLLHDNRLNADVLAAILDLFQQRGYRFITLKAALSDPAYQIPDTFITKFGPMWGYRWAREKGVAFDGSLEPEPPVWITNYR